MLSSYDYSSLIMLTFLKIDDKKKNKKIAMIYIDLINLIL